MSTILAYRLLSFFVSLLCSSSLRLRVTKATKRPRDFVRRCSFPHCVLQGARAIKPELCLMVARMVPCHNTIALNTRSSIFLALTTLPLSPPPKKALREATNRPPDGRPKYIYRGSILYCTLIDVRYCSGRVGPFLQIGLLMGTRECAKKVPHSAGRGATHAAGAR